STAGSHLAHIPPYPGLKTWPRHDVRYLNTICRAPWTIGHNQGLKEAENQTKEELIGKMTSIKKGVYRADPELNLVVWDRAVQAQPPYLGCLCITDKDQLSKFFTRLVIQDAGWKLDELEPHCYFHPFYGGLDKESHSWHIHL
ncbi:MAG: hypothetical protein AB7F31_04990, partial [Parachlamydiales bacterium]